MKRIGPISVIMLAFAVLCLSQAGNLIRLCETHSISIAFYRLFIATLILGAINHRDLVENIKKIPPKSFIQISLMGLFFALHFLTWIKGVQMTKVASAAICFTVAPVFVSIGSFLIFKERPPRFLWISLLLGFIGMIIIGGGDFSLNHENLLGDALAIFSALMFSVYFLIGKTLQQKIPNTTLMTLVYGLGALMALLFLLPSGAPLVGFNSKTIIGLVSLAIFPTILGHATLIRSLSFFKASTISALTLIEPVFAGLVAWMAYGEALKNFTFSGYVFILVGQIILIYSPFLETALKREIELS